MLFAIVFMIVLFVFLSGLKRERIERQLEREIKLKHLHNSSYKSVHGCPIYEDHFAIHNRMPIIE